MRMRPVRDPRQRGHVAAVPSRERGTGCYAGFSRLIKLFARARKSAVLVSFGQRLFARCSHGIHANEVMLRPGEIENEDRGGGHRQSRRLRTQGHPVNRTGVTPEHQNMRLSPGQAKEPNQARPRLR